jgi:integrase
MNETETRKRERGEGRISSRPGSKFLWLQYYVNGQQIRMSAKTDNEKKARSLLRKKVGALANGIVEDSRGLKYEHLRDSYIDHYVTNKKKSLRRDRKGVAYLESVRRLNGFFKGRRAVEIDADVMRQYQREQQAEGLSDGTINRALASLRAMFRLAQQDRKIKNIPFFPMLAESKPRQGTLPHEKYAALLAALPDDIRPIVVIAFNTGMRRGEIVGLRWSNVQWMDRIIRIEDSKNGDAREVPFAGELETVLKAQYAKRQPSCDFVCYRMNRLGHAQRVGNFRKVWSRICTRLGLGKMVPVLDAAGNPKIQKPRYEHSQPKPKLRYTGLLLHDLRRTFISDAEHSGAPRHEVMKISGHRSEAVYKRYAIENRENRRAALDRIAAYRAQKVGDISSTVEVAPEQEQSVIH